MLILLLGNRTQCRMKMQTNFEEWARVLIVRKVPENFSHLIDAAVIGSGADILKRGDAFEVHWQVPAAQRESNHGRIFVTPIAS